MGICNDVARIAVHHANIPNMISQVTGVLAADGLNINHMTNKSRGQYAYMLLDLENSATEEAIRHLEKIQGVFKVRVVK